MSFIYSSDKIVVVICYGVIVGMALLPLYCWLQDQEDCRWCGVVGCINVAVVMLSVMVLLPLRIVVCGRL